MKYQVGAYKISPGKSFNSNDEAVSFIQKRHPELSREEIISKIKPSIKEDDVDNRGRITEEAEQIGEGSSKANKKLSSSEQSGGNKQR